MPWNKYLKSAIKTRGSKITHVAKESCMPCSWALNTDMDKGTHRATCSEETFGVSHSDTERYLAGLELSPPYSWRAPSGFRSLGFPTVSVLFLSSRHPPLPGSLLSWDLGQPPHSPLPGLHHPHPVRPEIGRHFCLGSRVGIWEWRCG